MLGEEVIEVSMKARKGTALHGKEIIDFSSESKFGSHRGQVYQDCDSHRGAIGNKLGPTPGTSHISNQSFSDGNWYAFRYRRRKNRKIWWGQGSHDEGGVKPGVPGEGESI